MEEINNIDKNIKKKASKNNITILDREEFEDGIYN